MHHWPNSTRTWKMKKRGMMRYDVSGITDITPSQELVWTGSLPLYLHPHQPMCRPPGQNQTMLISPPASAHQESVQWVQRIKRGMNTIFPEDGEVLVEGTQEISGAPTGEDWTDPLWVWLKRKICRHLHSGADVFRFHVFVWSPLLRKFNSDAELTLLTFLSLWHSVYPWTGHHQLYVALLRSSNM